MARGNANESKTGLAAISRRLTNGMIVIAGDRVTTIDPTTEQMGHMCEVAGPEVKSAHKWNCAARKRIPRNKATILRRCMLPDISICNKKRRPESLLGQAICTLIARTSKATRCAEGASKGAR
jgi:hypothetical protein